MCEYCGCQALTEIDELTREHEAVVNMFAGVRAGIAAGDLDRTAALARSMAAILEPHTAVEEGGLFTRLADEFPDQVAVLEAEHWRIESVLAEAADGVPADPAWPARLLDILDLLRDHILKEQDGVFPAALANLSGEDWETVALIRASVGRDPALAERDPALAPG